MWLLESLELYTWPISVGPNTGSWSNLELFSNRECSSPAECDFRLKTAGPPETAQLCQKSVRSTNARRPQPDRQDVAVCSILKIEPL